MSNPAEELTRRVIDDYHRLNAEAVVAQLIGHGYRAALAENRHDALERILESVPAGADVGAGGSLTLGQLGVLEALRQRGHEVHYPRGGESPEEKLRLRHAGLAARVYLSGVNALTKDGEIVNLDGMGNRVAATCFGPERVIFVCGINKLCEDLESAVVRVREYAAPANAMRLELDTPCAATGFCHDCDAARRICNRLVIYLRAGRQECHFVLVNENLGL